MSSKCARFCLSGATVLFWVKYQHKPCVCVCVCVCLVQFVSLLISITVLCTFCCDSHISEINEVLFRGLIKSLILS